MHEQAPNSPSRFWRLNSVYRKLEVDKCETCNKGHIPNRPVCPDLNVCNIVEIKQIGGDIFRSTQEKVTTS